MGQPFLKVFYFFSTILLSLIAKSVNLNLIGASSSPFDTYNTPDIAETSLFGYFSIKNALTESKVTFVKAVGLTFSTESSFWGSASDFWSVFSSLAGKGLIYFIWPFSTVKSSSTLK